MPDNFLIRWKCSDCGTTYVVFSTFSICCDDVLERVFLCDLCRTEHPAATTAAACCAGKPRPQPVAAEPPPRRRPSLGKSAPMTEPRPPREKPTHRRHFGGFKMPVAVKADPSPIPIAPPVDVVELGVTTQPQAERLGEMIARQNMEPVALVPAPPPPARPKPPEPIHNFKPIKMTIDDEPAPPRPAPPVVGHPLPKLKLRRNPDPNCPRCKVAQSIGRVVMCECMVIR